MSAAPRYRSQAWREIGAVGVLIALWMVPWLALTAATWIAGGHPSASPAAFINPSDVVRRITSGIGPFQWWVLVSPTSTVVAWRFWTTLSLIVAAVTVCVIGARMQVAEMARGGFRRFLPSARRVVRVGRWARSVDLRSLRGRPGRDGIFLLGQHGRRPLVTQPETSVLVIGPTRSGKTAGLVIPNLLDWEGPAIATSTKSELVDITAGRRQSMGPVHPQRITTARSGPTAKAVTTCDARVKLSAIAIPSTSGVRSALPSKSSHQ